MLTTTLRTRAGRTVLNPSEQQLQAAINEMRLPEAKHPEASLASQTGHAISLYANGRVVFTDASQKGWMYELRTLSLARAMGLWMALRNADLEGIQEEPWEMRRADTIGDG